MDRFCNFKVAGHDALILDEFFKFLLVVMLFAAATLGTDIGSLCVNNILKVNSSFLLQVIDI